MRINKYLAREGHATRRGADELIEAKKVLLNGRIAVLGDKVQEGDTVELRSGHKPKTYKYFAYHKPRGIVTHSAQEARSATSPSSPTYSRSAASTRPRAASSS
jgi:23S rRNA pseudouridine2604 synthase